MAGPLAAILDRGNEAILQLHWGGELDVAQVTNFFMEMSTGLPTSELHRHKKCTFRLFQLLLLVHVYKDVCGKVFASHAAESNPN